MNTLSIYSSTAFTLIVSVLHYFLSTSVATQFEDIFNEFGAELPWLTKLILPGSLYYWIVPLLLAVWHVAHHLGIVGRRSALLVSTVGTIASIAICVIGIYLPIFQLGGVVSS